MKCYNILKQLGVLPPAQGGGILYVLVRNVMELAILGFMSLVVGFLCGCTSIGGILLIPAIAACTSLSLHASMATALCSFAFSASLGTYLHARNKTINWHYVAALGLGGLLFGLFGAFAKQHLNTVTLSIILAVLIILAGMNTLFPIAALRGNLPAARLSRQYIVLFALGGAVGFIAGLTGAGGPVISVPVMIALGYTPLLAVAVAQPYQVLVAISGSVGNIALGIIDYEIALWTAVLQVIGTAAGVWVAYRLDTRRMKGAVAMICLLTGAYMLIKTMLS